MAQTVDTSGLDRLLKSWEQLLKEFPEAKRQALEQMGRDLLLNVQEEIGGSGKVAGWQAPHLGSGGGYVAIRAKANEYQTTKSGKRYAVGLITNAIEGGHRHGGPRESGKPGYRHRSRIQVAAVPGRWMYQTVREQLGNMGQAEMDELLQTIIDGLEGEL